MQNYNYIVNPCCNHDVVKVYSKLNKTKPLFAYFIYYLIYIVKYYNPNCHQEDIVTVSNEKKTGEDIYI